MLSHSGIITVSRRLKGLAWPSLGQMLSPGWHFPGRNRKRLRLGSECMWTGRKSNRLSGDGWHKATSSQGAVGIVFTLKHTLCRNNTT